jgi:benzoyl-CoA reductase/2-hydroxyglutaryl-CoA dehydratase subunit BcrC/BadD/HgdB
MQAIARLRAHLEARPGRLEKARSQGRKIVGYVAGGYLPEELVLASGAIPVGLISGAEPEMVDLASAYLPRWMDTFWRNQIGRAVSGTDATYDLMDLLVVPMTDNHVRAMMDVVDENTEIDVFPFGVPHVKDDLAIDYYRRGIARLKAKLETLTGKAITDERLREASCLCNRERELLREISLMRKSWPPAIRCRDFVALSQGSFLADKRVMNEILESVVEELKQHPAPDQDGPRLLLTGSTLALGDSKVLDLIERQAAIVVEEVAEGLRPYWQSVDCDGDLLSALTDAYFTRRVPPAWFRPAGERRTFLVQLARDFEVTGVVCYQLLYRESYKVESYSLPGLLEKELGIPTLVLESDYDRAETGQMRTRIETFLEIISG